MRLHRLIAIVLFIESRGKMKAKELALALETSVRSIYRDIDILAEAGIPIVTASGPNGGISLMEGYTVNLKQLNGEDVINLYLKGMGIYADGQSESGLKLTNALLKLEKTLPPPYQADIKKARARFFFDDAPWWTERAPIPCLEALRAAVWRSRKLWIDYSKVSGERSRRKVHPYGLVVKTAAWYLVAYCEDVQDIRTFKCERMLTVTPTAEEFEIPADFSLEEQWHRQADDFKQTRKEAEYYPVVMRVKPANEAVLKKLEVLQIREEEDCLLATVNMYSFEAACRDVLAIIAQTEILKPDMLRQYAKEKINSLQSLYV